MDHSANVLLFDEDGVFFEPVGYQEDYDRVMDKIRRMQAG
jgi:protein SCO1/2